MLGAGISGLVSASILLQQGHARVLVIDEYPHVGGNHIDQSHSGYTFDVGSFVFQDDSPLLRHFPELLSEYVVIEPSWGKLTPQGVITAYPFSLKDDVLAAGPVECLRMLASVLAARLRGRRMRNARDFARYWLGSRLLYRSGLERYMERFCGLPAEKIDMRFAEKRMQWISEHATAGHAVRMLRSASGRPAEPPPGNRQLARPREGFTHLYAPAVRQLEKRGATFRLGERVSRIVQVDERYRLHVGSSTVVTDRVISTIPVDRALGLCGIPTPRALPTVTLISLFFSFRGERGFDQSILYNFSHHGAWKRLTVYSDFYGTTEGREFFGVEVIAGQARGSVEYAEHDFRLHTAGDGLLLGDLRLEGSYVLDNAYPIYTERAGERAEGGIAALRAFGLESFGRQGGFEYQPTARVSTVEAEAALKVD